MLRVGIKVHANYLDSAFRLLTVFLDSQSMEAATLPPARVTGLVWLLQGDELWLGHVALAFLEFGEERERAHLKALLGAKAGCFEELRHKIIVNKITGRRRQPR